MASLRPFRNPSSFGVFAAVAALGAAVATGCGSSVPALSTDGGGTPGSANHSGSAGAGSTGSAGSGGTTGAAGSYTKIPIGMTECSDGKDNDGDGLIDSADPECTGPADNSEATFATGIPGDNVDPCKQDCFFDGNSGMGDDGCLWQVKCDPLSTIDKCSYDQKFVSAHAMECSVSDSQSQHCIDFCRKFVPNGCDCFGCCAVPGAPHPIRLDPTCTSKDFNDPTKCSPCTQVTQCMNPCDRCELCVGKESVPADCAPPPAADSGTPADGGTPLPPTPDGGYHVCTDGVACTPGVDATCPAGYGCETGCCLPIIP
jgi:hypothetical protein